MAKHAKKHENSEQTGSNFFQFVKALIISLLVTFLCIIIFALIIKFASISDKAIVPVNLVIKALSIIVGTIILTKSRSGGLKKGAAFAFAYISLAFVIFSALSGSFNFNLSLLLDYVFGIVVGVVTGVIRVNTKRNFV